MSKIASSDVRNFSYVELMAFLNETNRPPGGKDSIRRIVQNCFITKDSKVLDVGCNTGYCSFEIAHLAKCSVTGVDINKDMIGTAKKNQSKDASKSLLKFILADGMKLPFEKEAFDVVMSGGSTAFIEDKMKAIHEYKRVLKQWGFIADINFFYKTKPPKKLIEKLNTTMGINIEPWSIDYWLNLYKRCGLERYYVYKGKIKKVINKEVQNYCSIMVGQKGLDKTSGKELCGRLGDIMNLFNRNHNYLDYGVFILRKRSKEEQISLFGA